MEAILSSVMAEVQRASLAESRAYLQGAMRDGTFNRLHGTIRIAQADIRGSKVLQAVIGRMSSRSWIYREGNRRVWVVESTCRLDAPELAEPGEAAAFARGYFDAEGGVPHESSARFYIQITQKDRHDLGHLRDVLERLGLRCGRLHNPSVRADPDYWRLYVLSAAALRFCGSHRIVAPEEAGPPCAQVAAVSGSASLPESRVGLPKPPALDRVRDAIRARHYSRRTEKSYVAWIRRYIVFHDKRHPPRWAQRRSGAS